MEPSYWLLQKHALFVALCRIIRQADLQAEAGAVWRTKYYATGHPIRNGFILGIGPNQEGKAMAIRIPDLTLWDHCYFAKELPHAPEITCVTPESEIEFLNELFP